MGYRQGRSASRDRRSRARPIFGAVLHVAKGVATQRVDGLVNEFLRVRRKGRSTDRQERQEISSSHGLGIREIELRNGQAESAERRAEILRFPTVTMTNFAGSDVLLRYAHDVGAGDLLDGFLVLEDEVVRVAVIAIRQEAAEGFGRGYRS